MICRHVYLHASSVRKGPVINYGERRVTTRGGGGGGGKSSVPPAKERGGGQNSFEVVLMWALEVLAEEMGGANSFHHFKFQQLILREGDQKCYYIDRLCLYRC